MPLPPLITLEEHFLSTAMEGDARYSEQLKWLKPLASQLYELGPVRLAHMDAGRVSLQVISHAPANPSADAARAANDQLAAAVAAHPSRFAGLAVLCMAEPAAAAAELERCVRGLGFRGALVDNHTDEGRYYDGAEWRVFWQAAQRLDVPVYLHPTWPTAAAAAAQYEGNYGEGAARSIGASGFGWHQDVGLHVLRLFASGLFDELPRLKVVVGHFGETLPFMLERVCDLSRRWGQRARNFRQVWDENVFITTSGVWSVAPMACILRNTRVENILYSVDYPFASNEDGLAWMEELERSGLVDREQLEAIAYKNAERLLRVKVEPSAQEGAGEGARP